MDVWKGVGVHYECDGGWGYACGGMCVVKDAGTAEGYAMDTVLSVMARVRSSSSLSLASHYKHGERAAAAAVRFHHRHSAPLHLATYHVGRIKL